MDGAQWVLKFAAPGDVVDTPLVEHATLTLAAKAGIVVAQTQALALQQGHAVAVKRFDRLGTQRLHALSANVALKAAGETLGYPELAQLLRRKGVAQQGIYAVQMRELFRRRFDAGQRAFRMRAIRSAPGAGARRVTLGCRRGGRLAEALCRLRCRLSRP